MKNPILNYIRNNVLTPRAVKFAVVGSSGVLVNMGVLYLLTAVFHIFYAISSVFAIEAAIITNFLLNNAWTWKDRRQNSFGQRFRKFQSISLAALLINWLVLIFFKEVAGYHYLQANLIGIACGTAFNFVLNDVWTFKSDAS